MVFDNIVLICFAALCSLSTGNDISEMSIIPIEACLIALANHCKPKSKRVKPRLASILVTRLTKPNCTCAILPKVDFQYFVHILFTKQSMIRYCRIYMYILEASVVQWLCHSPCKPGVAGSIPGVSSPSDGTINRSPVSI